ncbi:MAG: S49 family peptidase, partial [Bacteroidetes bacterium]|nr:S49 family peptidase [Bacteroidota bacterium]
SEGRGMTRDEVDSVAQGRVWTGTQALAIGLVDVIGNTDKAIEIAAKLAGLKEYRISEFPKEKNTLDKILEELSFMSKQNTLKEELGDLYKYYRTASVIRKWNVIQARLPFDLKID